MFDESSFKKTTIQFRNKAGNIVTLNNLPAMFQDVGMIVAETDKCYHIYGYTIDDGPRMDYDFWVQMALSPGAGVQLRARRGHSDVEVISGDDSLAQRDADYFFIGGLQKTKAKRSYLDHWEGKTWLSVDLDEVENDVSDIANPYIRISGHKRYASDVFYRTKLPIKYEDELNSIFYIINGQNFKSYNAFEKAMEQGYSELNSFCSVVALDTAIFPAEHYIKHYTINIPDWSYKWLACYEHSGCAYSENGTGMQCRWDTSSDVGVWYLTDWRLKDIIQLCENKSAELKEKNKDISNEDLAKAVEEYREDIVEKQFKHDMHVISDNNTAYAIEGVTISKTDIMNPEYETEALGLFEYVDFLPENAYEYMKNLVLQPETIIHRHTILSETKGKLYR